MRLRECSIAAVVAAVMATGIAFTLGGAPAQAQGNLRIGMTANDVPLTWGQPDNGFEGYRFMGLLVYDALINWDLTSADKASGLIPGLAESWEVDNADKTKWVFKLRRGVKFHDGSPLSAKDVHASFELIIFPQEGVSSARQAQFGMVESVTSPDGETVVFKLKYPSGAFIPALANPFNFIYSKAVLDKDQKFYEKNVMGSGPFVFDKREAGALISGKRNPNYYHAGKPYLDGFEAIFATKQSLRVQAVRGDQAAAEFRGFPPKSRDDLVAALGKDITVQESDWNCSLLVTPNHKKKPFDDVRVRRALAVQFWPWTTN